MTRNTNAINLSYNSGDCCVQGEMVRPCR